MPLVAGWLSDRYVAQAADHRRLSAVRSRSSYSLAGGARRCSGWWVGIVLMGLFTFAESPQLQALLGDIAPPSTRDASAPSTSPWRSASGSPAGRPSTAQ